MIDELRAILSSSEAVGVAIIGMIMAIFKAAKTFTDAAELHENHFVRKRLKNLKESRAIIPSEGPFTKYFDDAIQLEAFRIEFGIRACRLKALALLKIAELGYWNHIEIKRLARFLVISPNEPSPIIRITPADRIGAWFGLGAGVFFIIVGAAFWISITLTSKTIYAYAAGAGLFCAFTFAAGLFASGYGRYKNALRVQDYLQSNPEAFSSPSTNTDYNSRDALEVAANDNTTITAQTSAQEKTA